MNKLYLPTPDGYCGDEDNGQTSAWYVFSTMDFYPVCPGTTQYVLGAPLFKKITLQFENGKTLIISAPANNATNRYIKQVKRNGIVYANTWLDHVDLWKGGTLEFTISATPDTQRGTKPSTFPWSFSD